MKPRSRQIRNEILIAFLLAVIILAIIILTTDSSPQWIYQGF